MKGSEAAASDEQLWVGRFWLLVGIVTLLRLLFLAAAPIDLSGDEAYYWDWGRRPDWGYYSKPPLVGWTMALTGALAGASTFWTRFPAVLFGVGTVWGLFALTRRLYGARAGFLAALVFAANPGGLLSGIVMTIDAPLLCFWALSLHAGWRAVGEGKARPDWVGLAVVTVGLGLLSKQTMVLFPACLFGWLVTRPELRGLAKRPALYAVLAAPLLFLGPTLWWNARHGWITLRHTESHFEAEGAAAGGVLQRVGELVGSQAGMFSPVLWGLVMIVVAAALLRLARLGRRESYLVWFSGVPLLLVCLLNLHHGINANWPAPFYLGGIALLAGWTVNAVVLPGFRAGGARVLGAGIGVGAVMAGLLLAAPWLLRGTAVEGSSMDLLRRVRGWRDWGAEIARTAGPLPHPDRTFYVSHGHRTRAAELGFYHPQHPRVFQWNPTAEIRSQYDLWPGPRSLRGWDAVIVVENGDRPLPPRLERAFHTVEQKGTVRLRQGGRRYQDYAVYLASELREWPPRR